MRDDDEAWNELWRGSAPRLLAYLSSFGNLGPEERKDIVQQVFLKAWKARGRLEEGPRLSAWLIRAARNRALDVLKSRSRAQRRFPAASPREDGSDAEAPGPYPGPEEKAVEGERAAFMRRFLAGLNDADRELAELSYGEGLTFARIARITGRPAGTLKWRASKLRERLAAAYREEYGE
jgi:RNA polymerase sigma-70 factor, ECF subfamily